jgi:hypothetical protein
MAKEGIPSSATAPRSSSNQPTKVNSSSPAPQAQARSRTVGQVSEAIKLRAVPTHDFETERTITRKDPSPSVSEVRCVHASTVC